MSIHAAIEHRTTYHFDRLVGIGPHLVRLRPAPHCRTPILAYSLQVQPTGHFLNWQQDPFGNHLARLVFPEPARELSVTVGLLADMAAINPFDFFLDEDAQAWPLCYDPELARDLAPYLEIGAGGPRLEGWIAGVPRTATPTIDFLVALNERVRGDVTYELRMDPGVQAPEQTLTRASGSCRDSAWLLVEILRRLGIAARFASGYLVQLREDEHLGGDFTDLHAWAEAYVPGAGWVGLDPTSGLLAGEGHIPLACTALPASAAPISGTVDPCETTLEFSNTVQRILERPPAPDPYRAGQWERIDALGRAVDADLLADDVRLTMGGEPTFVAAGATEAPEWSTEAVGGAKLALARALALRLADALAPGALIHHGQGKWYPGEPLPRWQIGVHWRADATPLWHDRALLADPSAPGTATAQDAGALAGALARGLALAAEALVPAYEDPVAIHWAGVRQPAGEPAEAEDPRALAALEHDHGEPHGWAIPLQREFGDPHWSSAPWTLRRGRLFLIPGDSPLGLRLPLDALTWTPPEPEPERSRFAPVEATLPRADEDAAPVRAAPAYTALCVELRDGHPHVFLPPLVDAGHAVELIGLLERAAGELGLAVIVEGYPPPADERLASFAITPDPGVIEVNIHPSASWPELVGRTEVLDREARAVGLGTEKFALDGTHAGTGGGSHLTLGGTTPADSPLLRRPDLLRSLLTYWQHHPSLSYLFCGRFVGPTSQAPRVDESRHESLYELEIAFAELDRLAAEGPPPPWQVDRALRHLLVDVTGNTHRAEFCIDKLYSPDAERGRLGVVELRGFEMPPHPQMALVQALLVRALAARCWRAPYRGRLVRWGTELHDRFMLPWWVEQDALAVVEDLGEHGLPFEAVWLDPFLEFRFPRIGEAVAGGVRIELRAAIEPWHVLGEQALGASSRFVDSSLERLQVRVDGVTESRHLVTCNGRPVPLAPTATPGTMVGGVRYRAWQPPSALHPTIPVHSPLRFDVIDRWSARSLGGCTYHVTHPGGRHYERPPVNAREAQARRASRFEAAGHRAGPVAIDALRREGEYPRTLDLRTPRS